MTSHTSDATASSGVYGWYPRSTAGQSESSATRGTTAVSAGLLHAFEDCRSGNRKALRTAVDNETVNISSTIPFIQMVGVSAINASLLHVACAFGRLNVVDFLLARHAEVNYREGNGHYALHFAALGRHTQIVEMLLRRGADANCRNFQGLTPMHFAAMVGGTETLRCLLGKNSDVNATTYDEKLTPLHMACRGGHQASSQILVEAGALVTAKSSSGWAPLHFAAKSGQAMIVRLLLENGALIDNPTGEGDMALHLAAGIPTGEAAASVLVDAAGAPDVVNRMGETPLMFAAKAGALPTVGLFLSSGASVAAVSHRKQSILHYGVASGREDIVVALMRAGCPLDVVDVYECTPEMKARNRGLEAMALLIHDVIQQEASGVSRWDMAALSTH